MLKLRVEHALTWFVGGYIPTETINKPLSYNEKMYLTKQTREKFAAQAKASGRKFFANAPQIIEKSLLNDFDNSFPTGMLPKVISALNRANFQYEVEDVRNISAPSLTFGAKTGKYANINPYPYQSDAIDNILFKKRGLIRIACGGGKTLVAGEAIRDLNRRSVFLVNRKGLLYQTKEVFEQMLGEEIGQVGDGVVDIKNVNIVMIQSLIRYLGKNYDKFDDEDDSEDETDVVTNAAAIGDMLSGTSVIVMDECHCIGAQTAFDCMAAFGNAEWRIGLSVGGDSMVTIKDVNQEIKILPIKELASSFGVGMDKIVDVKENIQVRAYDGGKFVWRKLNAIHKYACNKKVFEITTDYGRKLRVTEDHSVFQVVKDGYYLVDNNKKYYGKLVEARGDELHVGDYLLLEDKQDNGHIKSIDVLSGLKNGKFYVAGNEDSFRGWIDNNIDTPKARWRYKNGRHGCYLPITTFNKSGLTGNKIYTEGANGHWFNPVIPCSAIAYLLGYYIGDGWVGGSRTCFAVPEQDEQDFLDKIKDLFKYADIGVEIRQGNGKSIEVRLNNKILAQMFCNMFPNQRVHNKRIPVEVFNWCREAQELVLRGIIDSDGHTSTRSENRIRTYYTTISEKLAWDLCEFLKIFGVVAGISCSEPKLGGVIEGRQIKGKHKRFQIHWSYWSQTGNNEGRYGNRSPFDLRGAEGQVAKIKSITEVQESEVFDLTVDDTENFVANGILVHNSATPVREDGKTIYFEACFGEKLADISFTFLIEQGFLVQPYIYMIPLSEKMLPTGKKSRYDKIYREGIVKNEIRNQRAVMEARSMWLTGHHPLVLVQHVKHGNFVQSLMPEATFLHGKHKQKERKAVLDEFCAGKVKSLIASTIFDEAIDIPACDGVVMLGGGASYVRTIQRMSRPMRLDRSNPKKDKCFIVDFWDADSDLERHSKLRYSTYLSEPAFKIIKVGERLPY